VSALLFTVSIPYLRAHAGRIFLTLLGVIIGVQGMVAMGALNHSIIASFEAGLEAIAGSARLQIAGPETGIPDSLAEEALRVAGVQNAVAIVDGSLTSADDPSLRVRTFGIDLLSMVGSRSPQFPREHVHIGDEIGFVNAVDSIALGQPLLDRLHLNLGDTIRLATPSGIRPYVIRGSLDDVGPTKLFGGLVALLDLPAAEDVFLSPGLTQTIYIDSQPDTDIDALATRLRATIGDRARVERTEVRGQQMDALLGSVRVALSLASLVTMIAAFFIIYETIAISVEQRRREIAITRSLGFTRAAVAGVFMLESLILGLLGAAGGVVGGYLLARLSLTTAVAGVSGMYFAVLPGAVSLPLGETSLALILGVGVCILAGAQPAFDAASEQPAEILRSASGAHFPRRLMFSVGTGVLLIIGSLVVLSTDLRLDGATSKTAWIMLGHALLLIGVAALAPPYARSVARLLTWLAPYSNLPVSLACEFFSRRPHRIAATATAIGIGFALVVVLGSVVGSIENTLADWISRTFGAEITVGMSPGLTSGSFDSSILDPLQRIPGVRSVERYRKGLFIYEKHPIVLAAFDRSRRPDRSPLLLVKSLAHAYEEASAGRAIFVSESFAFRYGLEIGDQMELETMVGKRSFSIAAIVRDYTMDLGTVLLDIDVYQHSFRDSRLTYAHIWPSLSADLERVRKQVNSIVKGNPRITVVTNSEFRAEVEGRVHDLLKVLGSLQLFACAIAVLGVINFLLAAILDRVRDIGILRTIGISSGDIRRAIMVEGGIVGLVGAMFGLLAGIPASYFMVKHSMPVAMGWSLDFRFPILLAITTIVAITAAAALAAYFPARRITRGTILAGLQME
jgi:putative ABC transport system permease protein